MSRPIPTAANVLLVLLCAVGTASIGLTWSVVNVFGATIPLRGYQSRTGQAVATAFVASAAMCAAHALWPRLPRGAPLALAVAVGLGVPVLAVGPNLWSQSAAVSFAGSTPVPVPEAIGAGKWLAAGAGIVVAAVAAFVGWSGRAGQGRAATDASADGGA